MIKRKGILFIIFILILALSFGCSASKEYASETQDSAMPEAEYDAKKENRAGEAMEMAGSKPIQGIENKIIYRAEMTLETEEFDASIESIENKVSEIGGYIENSSISGKGFEENDPKYAYYVLRIPKDKFNYMKKAAENWGNITYRNSSSEDVSEQYYDTEARLGTLKIQEERLQALLQKAGKIEDIISIERELQDIRYQIESHTGTIRKMNSLIDYSTMTMHVYEVKEVSFVPKSFPQEMGEAFKESARYFVDFVKNVIISTIYLLPYLIIVAVLIVIFRKKIQVVNKIPGFFRKKKGSDNE